VNEKQTIQHDDPSLAKRSLMTEIVVPVVQSTITAAGTVGAVYVGAKVVKNEPKDPPKSG
jgi:hypothetical protein